MNRNHRDDLANINGGSLRYRMAHPDPELINARTLADAAAMGVESEINPSSDPDPDPDAWLGLNAPDRCPACGRDMDAGELHTAECPDALAQDAADAGEPWTDDDTAELAEAMSKARAATGARWSAVLRAANRDRADRARVLYGNAANRAVNLPPVAADYGLAPDGETRGAWHYNAERWAGALFERQQASR